VAKCKYFLAIDFETTTFLKEGGQPIEFAAILMDLRTKEKLDTFHIFLKLEPGEEISEGAFETHGRDKKFLEENGVDRKTGFAKLWHWLKGHGVTFAPNKHKETLASYRGQLLPLGQNVGAFDVPIMERWAAFAGFDTIFMNSFTYNPRDTLNIAQFINDVFIEAFGYGAHPFKNPENGFPSVKLEHQALAVGWDGSGSHGAAWDIDTTVNLYLAHIKTMAADMKKTREKGTVSDKVDPLIPDGVLCPYCGTKMEDEALVAPGVHLYGCMMCGKKWEIVEVQKSES